MEKDTTVASDARAETTEKKLTSILYLLQTQLDEMKEEADRSYELHKIGEKTELIKYIEAKIKNPYEGLIDMSNNLDSRVKSLVNHIVERFLKEKKDLIELAFLTETRNDDLHYSIVLKEEGSLDAKMEIYDFLNIYDHLEPCAKFPVYFQFVPKRLVDKIKLKHEIEIS